MPNIRVLPTAKAAFPFFLAAQSGAGGQIPAHQIPGHQTPAQQIPAHQIPGQRQNALLLDSPDAWSLLEQETSQAAGLSLGAKLPPEDMFPGFQDAPSLQLALERLCRITIARRPWEELSLQRLDGAFALTRRHLDGRALCRRQEAELAMLALLRLLRRVLGSSWAPLELQFQHAAPQDTRPHRAAFGVLPLFGMGRDAMLIEAAALQIPVSGCGADAEPALHSCVAPSRIGLRDRVKAEIQLALPTGVPRIERVAEALRTTRWTLQRRLTAAGEVFSDLVDETRRDLARLYLRQNHLALAEIAALLGYSELSALTRASSRWFGQPPSRLRAAQLPDLVA
ncbi:helix-turn-helix domain-containing protein [Xinfangfangia sp. D13-10-4-6]|uniref:helix-turn-helix transcriptional regulator n=1 Tax=Pseudogemmobacter hezensis TaxID=2737662 RepID=UPI0015544B52|nr:AraC family transcriptional regulator ligand-binding domain-containing protein [Pseudogemmobacter hezensis]NPD14892.1 helix-turn-helix domain-containing protein [Pseudogemmobacter hezensis]